MVGEGDMVLCARRLLGVPFLHRGRTTRGLDCAGVLQLARKMAFGDSSDDRDYPPRPTSKMVLEKMSRHGVRVSMREAKPGDVVVLRFGSFSTHLGILTPGGVIHSVPTLGVIETSRAEIKMRGDIMAVFRIARLSWQ